MQHPPPTKRQTKLQMLEEQLEKLETELNQTNEQITKEKQSNAQLEKEIHEKDLEIENVKSQQSQLQKSIQSHLNEGITQISKERKEKQKELEMVTKNLKESESLLKEIQEMHSSQKMKKKEFQSQASQLFTDEELLKNELASLEKVNKDLKADLEGKDDKVYKLQEQLKDFDKTLDFLKQTQQYLNIALSPEKEIKQENEIPYAAPKYHKEPAGAPYIHKEYIPPIIPKNNPKKKAPLKESINKKNMEEFIFNDNIEIPQHLIEASKDDDFWYSTPINNPEEMLQPRKKPGKK